MSVTWTRGGGLWLPPTRAQLIERFEEMTRSARRAPVDGAEIAMMLGGLARRSGDRDLPKPLVVTNQAAMAVLGRYVAGLAVDPLKLANVGERTIRGGLYRTQLYGEDMHAEARAVSLEVFARMAKDLSVTAAVDVSTVPDHFGENLVRLRERARMTQMKLSVKTGIGISTLRDWEHGRHLPRPRTREMDLRALCKALGCKRSELLDGDE